MDGDSNIVEDAESRTSGAERMMSPSRQISAPTEFHCILRCAERSTHRGQGSFHQPFRPRKADPANRSFGQSPPKKLVNIIQIMRQFDGLSLSKCGGTQLEYPISLKQIADQPVFRNGELVARRQRN